LLDNPFEAADYNEPEDVPVWQELNRHPLLKPVMAEANGS
jgi:hypothetical protein